MMAKIGCQSVVPLGSRSRRCRPFKSWILVASSVWIPTTSRTHVRLVHAYSVVPQKARSYTNSCRLFASTQTPEELIMSQDALAILQEAIRAVNPLEAVKTHVKTHYHSNGTGDSCCLQIGSTLYRQENYDTVILVAFGKASSAMAKAVVERMEEAMFNLPIRGLVIVKDDHATQEELGVLRTHNVEIQEASHPVPDERSVQGATRILNMVREEASERTLVVCCISGGGSALFCAPKPPLTLQDLITTNEVLLASGMTIQQMNIIRKRLEMGKGGRLAAAAYPSTVVTLILSDILGDPLDLIASGPTVPDTSTWKDAQDLLVQGSSSLQSTLPPAVLQMLLHEGQQQLQEEEEDTIPWRNVFQKSETVLVGNNELAVMAAAKEAQRRGYHPVVLTTHMEGEARHVAGVYTAMAHHLACQRVREDVPFSMAKLPAAIIGGGETTVTLQAGYTGIGGRNQELALAAALQLKRYILRNVVLASVGTDGTDGPTDAAGAIVDGGTVDRLHGEAEQALQQHDAYTYFKQAAGNECPLIMTGPTGTNVADVCVTLIR